MQRIVGDENLSLRQIIEQEVESVLLDILVSDHTKRQPQQIMRSATGDQDASIRDKSVVDAARKGGLVRARRLSPERKQEIARKAAEARWKRDP